MRLTSTSPSQLETIAKQLLAFAPDNRIFLFYGDMGTGKTTLIKAICHELGVQDNVTSPTFSIVNEYIASSSREAYHFDFYRLKNQTEAMDLGYEEYFYSGAYCFIEWPEMVPDLLPHHYVTVKIEVTGQNTREIIIEQF
jgi:tRNA threonylcarbamoyladenosine biosynthesis protein TsaE